MILLFLIFNINMVNGQKNTFEKPIVITTTSKTTRVYQDENGEFNIDVHQDDLKRFKRKGFVRYGDMGAMGNGISDDMIFIVVHMLWQIGMALT